MRLSLRLFALVPLGIAAASCGPSIEVRTMAAPDAGLSSLRSFRMLPGPARRDGRVPTGDDDPMITNSIANRAIRDRIVRTFQVRGYALNDVDPDFAVAVYATAGEKLDVAAWDYGYPSTPGWPRYPRQMPAVVPYLEGSIVVDVIKLSTRELMWRGEGTVPLADDPSENVKQLAKAAESIVMSFPAAATRVVAERH